MFMNLRFYRAILMALPTQFIFSSLGVAQTSLNFPDLQALQPDKTGREREVDLQSGKKGDDRYFYAKSVQVYPSDIKNTEALITNFEEKCNNQHRYRRKFLSKEYTCPLFNKNLVESSVIKNLKSPPEGADGQEFWVIRRHVFNRGTYGHNDILTIKRLENKKTFITHTMITEEEAKKYIEDPVSHQEPFHTITGRYTLETQEDGKTQVTYEYFSQTNHFLLSKEIAVGQIFTSMADGTAQAMQTITDGLALKKGIKVGQN